MSADTAQLLTDAAQHPLNSRYGNTQSGRCSLETVHDIWRAIGDYAAERVAAQKGVELPGLGTLTMLKPVKGPIRERVPVFVVDKKFAKEYGVSQPGAMPLKQLDRAHPYAWANDGVASGTVAAHPLAFVEIASRSGLPLSAVSNIFSIVVQCLGERIKAGEVSLAIGPLGVIECCRGACQFLFDHRFCGAMRLKPKRQRPLSRMRGGTPSTVPSRSGRVTPARDAEEAAPRATGRRPPSAAPAPAAAPAEHHLRTRPAEVKVAWDNEDREVAKRNNNGRTPSPVDPYAVGRGSERASSVSLTDATGNDDAVLARKHFSSGRHGASPIPEQDAEQLDYANNLYMNAEQVFAIRRMCRLLDVFAALDRSGTNYIKAHDLSIGLSGVLGVNISGAESHALVEFLNKGRGEKVSRMEFVRAFQFHERVAGPKEPPLRMELIRFGAGEVMMEEGAKADDMMVLESGVAVVEKNGKVVHSYARPGEYFGGLSTFAHTATSGTRAATVRASEAVSCVRLFYQHYTEEGVPTLSGTNKSRASAQEPLVNRRSPGGGASRRVGKLGPKKAIDPHALLCRVPLFAAMSEELTQELAAAMELKSYPKKRWISREGDFGEGMFIVAEGVADVISAGVHESEEATLRLRDKSLRELRAGDYWEELTLFYRERRKTSSRSRIPAKVLKLGTREFEALIQPHAAQHLGVLFMAQQQRIFEIRGDGPPAVFGKVSQYICDDMLSLSTHNYPTALGGPVGVSVWQLRNLCKDVLVNWTESDIDWLLAGGMQSDVVADPATSLCFNDPKQRIDYNKLVKGVDLLEEEDEQMRSYWRICAGNPSLGLKATLSSPSAVTAWKDWRREWSDEHQRFYYSTSTPRGTNRTSQWKPPASSPWAPKEVSPAESPVDEPDSAAERIAGARSDFVPHTEARRRSTSPWTVAAVDQHIPKWLRDMRESIEARAMNVHVLFRNFDTDNSGTVDYEELKVGLEKVGLYLRESEFLELIDLVDPHGAGEIEIKDLDHALKGKEVHEQAFKKGQDSDSSRSPHASSAGKDWMRETFQKLREYIKKAGMTWPQAFKHFRTGRHGDMSPEDFYGAIRKANSKLSSWQMDQLLAVVDTNSNGRVTLEEWLYRFEDTVKAPDWEENALSSIKAAMNDKGISVSSLLRRLDTSGDGILSVHELARGIVGIDPKCSRTDAMEIARTTDTDSTGMVNMHVLTEKLTGQVAGVADWEDDTLKKCRKALLSKYTTDTIAQAFAKFDLDGSGTLNPDEFRRGILSLGVGLTVGQIEKLRDVIDDDGDGEISFDEFVTRFLNRQVVPVDEVRQIKRYLQLSVFDQGLTWRKLFDRMDDNRSSLVSVEELKEGLLSVPGLQKKTNMTETTVEGLFLLADKNEDGFLSYSEFLEFFSADGQDSIVPEETAPTELSDGDPMSDQSAAAIQTFRNQIFKRKLSLLEAFRAFDVDHDGFMSREEFLEGFSGKSRSVAIALGNMKGLGLSTEEVMSIYNAMPGAQRDFVDFDGFSAVAGDEKPPGGWEDDIVKTVHNYMHRNAYTVDNIFKMWNYRSDGMLDLTQLVKGLNSCGVDRSASVFSQFFRTMDDDQDGIVNIDGFRQRFNYSLTTWDWCENALQTIASVVMTGFPTPEAAFRSYMDRAAEISALPMDAPNFKLFFADIDEVQGLNLRTFEWKHLFHTIDADNDGVINEEDFCKAFRTFVNSGRVTPVQGTASVPLSSAEVFRRADSDADGFLDTQNFRVAIKLVRPQADEAEIQLWWRHVDREQRGRVTLEEFCQRMASRPKELDWEAGTVEEIQFILSSKRGALERVFNLDGEVLSRAEFHDALIRLGLGISKEKCNTIFDRVDVAGDGAIDVREFIAFVNGATTTDVPPSALPALKRVIQKHLGSAEVFFLWTLKKCKLNSSTKAISDVHFAKGIEALVNLSDDAPAALLDDKNTIADLFRRAGGRSKIIQMNKFMKFFADDVEGPFEAELPNAVKVVAQHRLPFTSLLTKASRNGKDVSAEVFQSVLAQQFPMMLTENEWVGLMTIADTHGSGVVQYRNFINRCALRLDAHQTHSTRRRDTLRRDQKYSSRQRGTPDSMSYHELMKARCRHPGAHGAAGAEAEGATFEKLEQPYHHQLVRRESGWSDAHNSHKTSRLTL